ncbi:MAG: hypothetical protein WCD18_01850 [Thermosynechococcaceae cyanobacterium]
MGRTQGILSRLPHFYPATDPRSLLYQILQVFGQTLDDGESDLLKVMFAHYVDTASNEGSQGFNTNQKGDLDQIFSLYLENLGGTSQLKQVNRPSGKDGEASDALYRKRILGLINVLKNGASTKEGIIEIVAANLGIIGDEPEAIAARQQICITEFLPEFLKTDLFQLGLFDSFTVQNPNFIDTIPEIRLRLRSDLSTPLNNPRLVNLTTGQSVQYAGPVQANDVLSFFANNTALLNGVVVPIVGATPALPPGSSVWRLEAALGLAKAQFDIALFDFSLFEQARLNSFAVFDTPGSVFDQAIFPFPLPFAELGMTLPKLTPASFKVDIPWDIPGFTEDLDKFSDRPREQIKFIVDKVKAAGVFAVIAYEKKFSETHALADSLTGSAQRQPLEESHELEEANFDLGSIQTPYPGGLTHDLSDTLTLSGAFDLTRFNSLNTFA